MHVESWDITLFRTLIPVLWPLKLESLKKRGEDNVLLHLGHELSWAPADATAKIEQLMIRDEGTIGFKVPLGTKVVRIAILLFVHVDSTMIAIHLNSTH